VVLAGDAFQDYRDYLGRGGVNYVPAQLVQTDVLGDTPSDNGFVCVSGDDIFPDMFIGRLPAEKPDELAQMIDKIIYYEQHPPDSSWNQDVLLVADDEPSFETISEELADRLPFDYDVNRIYATAYQGDPPQDPTSDILSAMDAGQVLVNYAGHGHVAMWGRVQDQAYILDRQDLTTLQVSQRFPVVSIANCANGYFAGPELSMAEEFLRLEDRGAVAVWAPTGFSYPSSHQIVLEEFYEAIFQDDQHLSGIGAATTAAKIAAASQWSYWNELVETFVLFGDPAMQLGIPTNAPYVESTTPTDGITDVPIDQTLRVRFSKPMDVGTVALDSSVELDPSVHWSADDKTMSVSHTPFTHGDTVTVTVQGGEDLQGASLVDGPVPRAWSFTVTEDDVPPTGTVGLSGESLDGVSKEAPLTISFSEPMRKSSVSFDLTPSVYGWLAWDREGRVATFYHFDFATDQEYTFSITAAKDLAGNELVQALELTFTTQDLQFVYLPLVVRAH